jgi:anti-sigma factor RsiW
MTTSHIPEMTCRELVELVTDYLEGGLSRTDRERFDAHLADCEDCGTYLEQMQRTIRALGRLPEASLSDEARGALLEAFRDWPRP